MAYEQTNLIINYLPQTMNERFMKELFSRVGLVESVRIMRDYKTGYSFGFGFVNYVSAEDARAAIEQLNGFQIGYKRIKVSYARPPSDSLRETNLYITNLPSPIQEEDLEKMFGEFGTIVQKNLLRDRFTGKPRGAAFVRFDKREEAQAAIKALDGQLLGPQPLSVRVAEEHGRQKAAFFAGLQAGLRHHPYNYPPCLVYQ